MRKSRFTVHILATDRRTDGQTHKQMDNPNTLSCLRYCKWWLNKQKRKRMHGMCQSRIENHDTKHTSTCTWPVIMWTLSHVITISFCLNLHSISTCT